MTLDLRSATRNERILCFGEAFRDVPLVSISFASGVIHLVAVLDGQQVTLVGDPEKALMTYRGEKKPVQTGWLQGVKSAVSRARARFSEFMP